MCIRDRHYLRESWGKEERRERDFSEIGSLFEYAEAGVPGNIDRQTWDDLDLGQVYHRLDRTLTNPGEAVLYHIIRTPLYDSKKLLERALLIRFFQDNAAEMCIRDRYNTKTVFMRIVHRKTSGPGFSFFAGKPHLTW